MASSSPAATPKRKRGPEPAIFNPIKFSFDPSQAESSEDGGCSPQSKVAHRFRGLALGSGGGDPYEDVDDADGTRKRQKPDQVMLDAGLACHGEELKASESSTPGFRPHEVFETQAAAADSPRKQSSSLDVDDKPATKSPRRKRAGTPPLKLKKSPTVLHHLQITGEPRTESSGDEEEEEDDDDNDDTVVEPIRAALTWHEDEITVYDPEDEDDDGTGVNGIGFRPTPALAHARAMRRRQQMAEYHKREEGDARTKRSHRRRGEVTLSARPKKKSPARRVRFIESEQPHLTVTTQ